jgi:hypothetical protein
VRGIVKYVVLFFLALIALSCIRPITNSEARGTYKVSHQSSSSTLVIRPDYTFEQTIQTGEPNTVPIKIEGRWKFTDSHGFLDRKIDFTPFIDYSHQSIDANSYKELSGMSTHIERLMWVLRIQADSSIDYIKQ